MVDPDFASGSVECVEASGRICPGQFQLECPGEPGEVTVDKLGPEECDCVSQLLITADCKDGY